MLRLKNLSAKYDLQGSYVHAINQVNLTVQENEILGLAGESGCGKSTLLRLMYDNVQFPLMRTEGEVVFEYDDGTGPKSVTSGDIRKLWWKELTMVPQGAMHVLNPVKKIIHQFVDVVPEKERRDRRAFVNSLEYYLKELNLDASVLDAYAHQLSGGMKQRLLIALATFRNPSLILADEPTTALDVVVQRQILTMLKRVQRQMQNSIVIVTHDLGVHYQITDRLAIMYAGEIVEQGPTRKLFREAAHPYTQMLIGALPRVGDLSAREGIAGRPPDLKDPPPGCRFADRCPYVMPHCSVEVPPERQVEPGHVASCHLLTDYPVVRKENADVSI